MIKTISSRESKTHSTIISESKIFDSDFYNSQLDNSDLSGDQAILHYLNVGATNKLDPHPLFDTPFYIRTNTDIDFATVNPLIHFLTSGWQEERSPHPLFDVHYYLDRYQDVRQAKINPLRHFILFGAKEHRHPCQFFDAVLYKKKVHDLAFCRYFAQYLAAGKKISFSNSLKTTAFKNLFPPATNITPSPPVIKQQNILRRFKSIVTNKTIKTKTVSPVIKIVENPLLHFLGEGIKLGLFPFPSFAMLYDWQPTSTPVLRIIPRDLTRLQSVPTQFENIARQINKAELSRDKLSLLRELIQSLTIKKDAPTFMRSKSTILLTSHQAAYTGSPMLLLRITRELSGRGFECLLLLDQSGELANEFSEVAHIIDFKNKPDRYRKCAQYLSLLFDDLGLQRPKACLLNSLETGPYAKAIDEQGIKIISLVHEIADDYPSVYLQDVFSRSQSIVYPAHFVKDFAHRKIGTALKSSREFVIPNALLQDDFGNYDRKQARSLLTKEIAASDNALIVLACGSPDLRKGIDHFVTAARIIIAKRQQEPDKLAQQPIHFVWIGAGKIGSWSAHYYIDWDLRQENPQSRIHLLPPRKNLRPAFRGADIFILPSRQDPFPLVVQNAMAAGLPVVAFRGAGGVPEMLANGGAEIIPYGDVLAFAQAIEEYLNNEQKRRQHGELNKKLVAERFRFSDYFARLEETIRL